MKTQAYFAVVPFNKKLRAVFLAGSEAEYQARVKREGSKFAAGAVAEAIGRKASRCPYVVSAENADAAVKLAEIAGVGTNRISPSRFPWALRRGKRNGPEPV